jgi:opacity protein-like surface antigen
MFRVFKRTILAASVAGLAAPAFAADPYYPPIEDPAPGPVYEEQASVGGWYLRGDIDYHWSDFRGGSYILYGTPGEEGEFETGELKGAMSLGAGVGYQINNHFRTDLTADYFFKSDFEGSTEGFCGLVPCTSRDTTSYQAWLLLANAYVDLGTWHKITPYVGAGIGGAWVKWDTLRNVDLNGEFEHEGGKGWRFAYALMAGASYCVTDRTKLDLGYRFSHIEGGRMFDYAVGGGPGFDDGINVHEVRGGLRYQFGESDCAEPTTIAYEPEPVTPVYK